MVSFILSIMFLSILPCMLIMMVVKGIWRNINENVSSIKYYLKYPFYMKHVISIPLHETTLPFQFNTPNNIITFDMLASMETLTISWKVTYNIENQPITQVDWHVTGDISQRNVKFLFTNKEDAMAFKLEFM